MVGKPLFQAVVHPVSSAPHTPPPQPTVAQVEAGLDAHLGLTSSTSSLTLDQFLALFPHHGDLPAAVIAHLTAEFNQLAALSPSATLLTQSDIVAAVTSADANHDGTVSFAEAAKATVHLVGVPLHPPHHG